MKRLPCLAWGCAERRVSWDKPDIPRGVQYVEVPDDYEGKVYCSIECAMYDGVKLP